MTWNGPCFLAGFFAIMNYKKVNICYPLAGTAADEVIVDAKAATEYKVDIAEWRADLFEGKEYKEVLEKIREVYEGPLIFTCRNLRDLNLYKTIGGSGLVD